MIFDALIADQRRKDYDELLVPAEGRIALVDHEGAFSTNTEVDPQFLPSPCAAVTPSLEHALASLERNELQSDLGEYLSEAQINALLVRRDKILELCLQSE